MFTLKEIIKNGGITLDNNGNMVDSNKGYQVSVRDMEIIKVRDMRKKHLVELLTSIEKNSCLGVWIEKGLAYIDNSKTIATKKEAVKIGKKNKQISIFGWNKKEVIYL